MWVGPSPGANWACPTTAPEACPVLLVLPGSEFLHVISHHIVFEHQADGEGKWRAQLDRHHFAISNVHATFCPKRELWPHP